MAKLYILFDMDGTLVDSEILGWRAFHEMIPELEDEAVTGLERYRGMKLAEIMADVSARFGLNLGADFVPHYRAHAATLFDAHLTEIPGSSLPP